MNWRVFWIGVFVLFGSQALRIYQYDYAVATGNTSDIAVAAYDGGPARLVATTSGASTNPTAADDDQVLVVVWEEDFGGGKELYYAYTFDAQVWRMYPVPGGALAEQPALRLSQAEQPGLFTLTARSTREACYALVYTLDMRAVSAAPDAPLPVWTRPVITPGCAVYAPAVAR